MRIFKLLRVKEIRSELILSQFLEMCDCKCIFLTKQFKKNVNHCNIVAEYVAISGEEGKVPIRNFRSIELIQQ